MVGEADRSVRLAVFSWLTEQREASETLARDDLLNFSIAGVRIPLLGPQGICKPAACELPISIATVEGNYPDEWNEERGELRYSYRGTDPNHWNNVGLRRAMAERVPLVYFLRVVPSRYVAMYPVLITGDDPTNLVFNVQVEDMARTAQILAGSTYDDAAGPVRRAYVTRVVRQRVHQAAFRERVVRAYREQCALCRLRHQVLLDAAHITPDREADSEPVISNGVALCKLHHAAFDNFFFAIKPDFTIEVRPSILSERDGPMLVVGLQEINGHMIELPRRPADFPDQDRLARRYAEFLRSA